MVVASKGRFDYVVVGAGSAGCVLANRLSADPRVRVCLVEAGGKDWYPWIHIPVGYFYTFDNPRTDWRYRTEPDAGLNGRSIKYPRGKVLGGSSSINAMVYIRGQAADYDAWRDQGNAGWSWDEVLPYFKKSEDQCRGPSATHGIGGEMRVEDLRAGWDVLDRFVDAAVQCGIPKTDDFNSGDNEGVGYFQVTQRNGFRVSAATAFLNPAKKRPNLTVITNALASRIELDGRRATGLTYIRDGVTERVDADREVVLAAGSIGSPQLLMLSGIGDAHALGELGIESRHHLRGVGANLQDHLAMRTMLKVHGTPTLNEQSSSTVGRVKIGLEYLFRRRGPMTIPPALVTAFVKSDPSQPRANLQFVCYPLTYDKTGDPPHAFPGFTAGICLLHPESRGSITLKSSNPADYPAIRLNFLATEKDRSVAIAGLRAMRRVCAAPALQPFSPEEFAPGPQYSTDEELIDGIGNIGATIFHPVGTCKMGSGDGAVVDDRLRVHGIDRLRVVDASIMPTIISGNTNAATTMIAEKASDMLLDDARTGRVP